MPRWSGAAVALILISLAANSDKPVSGSEASNEPPHIRLMKRRMSTLDLEIGGELAGASAQTARFISREELLKLPQVSYRVSDDANFKKPVEISGVLLEDLAKALGVVSERRLVVAICTDEYHAHYPTEYVARHHPVLVLKIDGQGPEDWPKDAEGRSEYLGPFLISHAKFAANSQIPAHEVAYEDEPQIPWGVVRLEFRDETKVFGGIAPRGPHAKEATVKAGFRIARQNCFRCHNLGEEGGKKAGRPWEVLAIWASASPERFAAYVKNPQAVNVKSQMEASPQYDDASMKALLDYFRTLSGKVQR